jgi:AraC-like DNA-binding protein
MPVQPIRITRCRLAGIEAVEADTAHRFGRHTHEQFGIGLIERGAQRSASGRGVVEANVGDLISVNPGEVHDGAPLGHGGRAWRMLYFEPSLIAEAAKGLDVAGEAGYEFTHPVIHDTRLAEDFRALYPALTATPDGDGDALHTEELLLTLLRRLTERRIREPAAIPGAIALVREMIDDDPAAPQTLATLADAAGLSRFQLLRGFKRGTGLTPHAYLMQRRLHLARRLLTGGLSAAETASASGFCDQSHLTRHFLRSFGLAPGAYAQASAAWRWRGAIPYKTS